MMKNFINGFAIGLAITLGLFALLGFTPHIKSVDVERAIVVCKDGKWDKINNTEIYCADGAVYPRKGE